VGVIAVVDTGPLYAAVDADDQDHSRCLRVMERADLELVVPALVVAEATYLIGRRLGPAVEAAFLRSLEAVAVPLGGTDASVAALAERLDTGLIITLDRRHFSAIKTPSGRTFRLLPD
jgi:predicted nucleic acid-binding protein